MTLKKITLREGTYKITTDVNICDICDEGKSEHTCAICHRWICKNHSVHIDIEIGDDWIPYICTECQNIKRYDETYVSILRKMKEQYDKLLNSKNAFIKEWEEKAKKSRN